MKSAWLMGRSLVRVAVVCAFALLWSHECYGGAVLCLVIPRVVWGMK